METSALDVLGSVLLGYLERVGETIATNVEGSGRSSSHVNAYDVLNAVEGCTVVAATQLRSSDGGPTRQLLQQQHQQPRQQLAIDQGPMIQGSSTSERGWEGLASFLFGSNWYSIPLEGDVDTPNEDQEKKSSSSAVAASSSIMNGTTINNGSGKGGPSSSTGGGKMILPAEKTTKIQTTPTTTSSTAAAATTKKTVVGGAKSGKGKQLSNMTPPPGVSVVGNEVIMANNTVTTTTTSGGSGGGTSEKNVSFALERKNSKGAGVGDTSILLDSNNSNNHSNDPSSGRWDAPYLNEVAPFPLVTRTEDIANPHCLSGTNISLSMHDLATEQEACRDNTMTSSSSSSLSNKKQRRGSAGSSGGSTATADWKKDIADLKLKIPKDVFATKDIIWGSIKEDNSSSNKKKMKNDITNGSNTNKTTTAEDKSFIGGTTGVGGSLPKLPAVKMPSYVPNFLPPFPRTEESISSLPSVPTTAVMSDVVSRVSQKRKSPFSTLGSSHNNETVAAERNNVRHSLVELGKNVVGPSYWGSNWFSTEDDDDDVTRKSKEKLKIHNAAAGQLKVTPGPSSSASLGRPSDTTKKGGGGGADAQVVPLARASGSRVAKILEGSN